jgi:hypothetical protein
MAFPKIEYFRWGAGFGGQGKEQNFKECSHGRNITPKPGHMTIRTIEYIG